MPREQLLHPSPFPAWPREKGKMFHAPFVEQVLKNKY